MSLVSFALALVWIVGVERGAAGKAPVRSSAGAPVGPALARPTAAVRDCDVSMPVCVYAGASTPSAAIGRARDRLANAWSALIETMRLPRPMGARLDAYLVRNSRGDSRGGIVVGRDSLDLVGDHDAAPAFLLVDEALARAGGCQLDSALASGVVRASAMALDVAETPAVVEGFAQHLAELVAPCGARGRFATIQRDPWRALTATATGNEALALYLDRKRGPGFGAIVPALLSMATQHRGVVVPRAADELGPAHFHDDPTVFDVLSATLGDQGSSLDDLFVDAAVDRALDPGAYDGAPPPAREWVVKASQLPRRLLVSRGVEATGATYVEIELDVPLLDVPLRPVAPMPPVPPAPDGLEVDLKWDQGARFRWRIVKLDARGKLLGELVVPPLERARDQTVEVRHLEGASAVLVVGVDVGDPLKSWTPDDPPGLAHGYEIGVYRGR